MSVRTTRAEEMRAHSTRPKIDFIDRGQFHIDPTTVPPGFRYQWCAEFVYGEYQQQRLTQAQLQGWRPVPADRHPELVPPPLPGRERETVIRAGGQILMERSEEICRAAEDYHRRETEALTRAKEAELGIQSANGFERLRPELSTTVLPPPAGS